MATQSVHTYDLLPVQRTTSSELDNARPVLHRLTTCGPLRSREDAQWASDQLRFLGVYRKQWIAKRDEAIGPLKAVILTIQGWFRPVDDACADAEAHLKRRIQEYRTVEAANLQASLAEAKTQAEVTQSIAAAQAPIAGVVVRESWGWEVVDESKIPREYWVLDTKALDAEARKAKAGLRIPGIKPVRKESIARSGR